MADKCILQQLQEQSTAEIMNTIYEQVNSLLGAGNQMFAMEFPARAINGSDYTYATDDCYSTLTKPYPVQEAEFLLSDQLFDISPVVQGSNGERLSTVYTTILNNFVPKLKAIQNFVHDQKYLRGWLLKQVETDVGGEKKTLSRMAIAKKLYADYLKERNDWYKTRDTTYNEYKAKKDLDGYARWLSSEGLVKEEEINNFFNDAVVQGNYHEVLTLLGFLNVSSPAEVLETTKQKMRSSLRRSLDGSTDIYPVQFQPSDWFKSLRPNLSPKDLTMATDSLLSEYRAKQARLRALQALLAEQTVIEIPVEEQQRLQDNVKLCEAQLSAAQQELMTQYGEGAVKAVKAVINIYKNTADPYQMAKEAISAAQEAAKAKTLTGVNSQIYSMIEGIASDVVDGVLKSSAAQQKLFQKSKEALNAKMAYSEARVKDMRLEKIRIAEQIESVRADLDFLTPLVTGTMAIAVKNAVLKTDPSKDTPQTDADKDTPQTDADKDPPQTDADKDPPPVEAALIPDRAEDSNNNDFSDIIIKCNESGSFSEDSSASSSSQSSWHIGGWFWSAGGEQSSSSAQNEDQKKAINKKLEIGFRIKKVAFDRGGWFNPNIFKLSNNYFRLADIRYGSGLTKDEIHQVINTDRQNAARKIKNLCTYQDDQSQTVDYLLPSFPTGFVIAKDITIRIASDKSESESCRKYMESNRQSGGGFFGFQANSSDASATKSSSTYFGSTDKYFYLRIPGPQILGWFLQFTPTDNASSYEELDPTIYEDTLQAFIKDPDVLPEESLK